MKKFLNYIVATLLLMACFLVCRIDVKAVSYPNFTVEFDETDQSVIVAGVPAYDFNWTDAEFLLPCSGEYVFTAWVAARDATNGFAKIGTSPAVSITFTYTKADESTNWGPGLPNTTV